MGLHRLRVHELAHEGAMQRVYSGQGGKGESGGRVVAQVSHSSRGCCDFGADATPRIVPSSIKTDTRDADGAKTSTSATYGKGAYTVQRGRA